MDELPDYEERLRRNYNPIGVAVMQAMYSDDYLSVGGSDSTDDLARLAGVDETATVLDIGCGVGGPTLRLASTLGCTVTGIDLVQASVDQARDRAQDLGLDHLTTFEQGDATSLPFEDGSFDVVWGQDAWCHVPDKPALLAEAKRVLRPGGTLAFTDWLAGDGLTPSERETALAAALSTNAASTDGYLAMLDEAGFVDIDHTDIGETFRDQYRTTCSRLQTIEDELTERFGERVFSIVSDMNTTILHGFEGGAIGGGRFLAKAPA